MPDHARLDVHEFVHHWWFHYDEGRLDVLARLLTDDCRLRSRTERGDHPHEAFIASDSRGAEAVMRWTRDHRRLSPYPLRHNASNVFVAAERGDEVDVESYLFVTQIVGGAVATLSSGIVHWNLRLGPDGYRLADQEVVLDAIESVAFEQVPEVSGRMGSW